MERNEDAAALSDYRSDESALAMCLLKKRLSIDTSVEFISLSKPVPLAAAIQGMETNAIEFTASYTVRFSRRYSGKKIPTSICSSKRAIIHDACTRPYWRSRELFFQIY